MIPALAGQQATKHEYATQQVSDAVSLLPAHVLFLSFALDCFLGVLKSPAPADLIDDARFANLHSTWRTAEINYRTCLILTNGKS